MKINKIYKFFIVLFLALCLIPAVGMLVFGPSDAAANEVLSSKPRLMSKDGNINISFLSDISDYIGDRFFLRKECINAWAVFNSKLLGTSVDDSVILGENGILYYSETLDDYMGTGLSNERLVSVVENLSLIREYVETMGADFVFTVAPNKNSLYPENMPVYIPSNHASSNSALLPDLLADKGIAYADLFASIGEKDEILYFNTDSHWNSRGAALGADTILKSAGISSNYYDRDFEEGETHRGDLYEMLYPTGKLTEMDYKINPDFTFKTEASTNSGKALTIHAVCPNADGTLVCWRDSFGNALYPFLAESFSKSSFYREATYDLTRLIGETPDTVIIELVERNINWLITYSPVLPSPQRTISPTVKGTKSIIEKENGKNNAEAYIHLLCSLSLDQYDEGTPAYICVNGIYYQAFVTYSDTTEEVCLSVWVPSQEVVFAETDVYSNGILTAHLCEIREK